MTARFPIIAADVGGTHARLALATRDSAGRVALADPETFACREFASLPAIVAGYRRDRAVAGVSIACAGFAVDGHIAANNLPWDVDLRELRATLGVPVSLLNDFEAVAYSTLHVAPSESIPVVTPDGPPLPKPQVVLGPGTGLGAAVLIPTPRGTVVLATESGHAGFAPATPIESEILAVLREGRTHVATEHLISGPGLLNVYRALCRIRGRSASLETPAAVSGAAVEGSDATAREALSVFCGALGSLAGNLVLAHGAPGGVSLAGGILPKFRAFLLASDFRERFLDKGVMRGLLERVPVRLIEHGQLGVLGAAHWQFDQADRA